MIHEPYAPRAVRCLDVWATDGWRLKVYGIAYRGGTRRPELIEAAKLQAASSLRRPATSGGRYGVGFLGIHDGRDANLVFVDWWADENELHHKVCSSLLRVTPGDCDQPDHRSSPLVSGTSLSSASSVMPG